MEACYARAAASRQHLVHRPHAIGSRMLSRWTWDWAWAIAIRQRTLRGHQWARRAQSRRRATCALLRARQLVTTRTTSLPHSASRGAGRQTTSKECRKRCSPSSRRSACARRSLRMAFRSTSPSRSIGSSLMALMLRNTPSASTSRVCLRSCSRARSARPRSRESSQLSLTTRRPKLT